MSVLLHVQGDQYEDHLDMGGFNTADYYPRGKKKKNNVIKFRLKGKGKKVEKNR
ncbi:hypothetical protein bcgnr5369_68300 [Bacillus cereus]